MEYLMADAMRPISETYFSYLDPYIKSTAIALLKSFSALSEPVLKLLLVSVSINSTTTELR